MLLADIQDILGAIVPVLFVIFWVISQVIGGINKARKGQAEPSRQPPPQKIPPSSEEDALAKEIERFLGQKRESMRPQEQLPRPADQVVTAEVSQSPVIDQTKEKTHGESLANFGGDQRNNRVERRKDLSRKDASSTRSPIKSTLAKKPRLSDGSRPFPSVQSSTPPPITVDSGAGQEDGILELPDNSATDSNPWHSMMGDPTALRQAFFLSQIFSRPEDRW